MSLQLAFLPDDSIVAESKSPPPAHVNFLFRLATAVGAVFVITIFAYVALLFGDTRSPVARFLNAHAGRIFLIEVGALIVVGIAAMMVDRRQTMRHRRQSVATGTKPTTVTAAESEAALPPSTQGASDGAG